MLLDPTAQAAARLDRALGKPLVPERESWGTDEESVAAYSEAEKIAGGPAPMRERSDPRASSVKRSSSSAETGPSSQATPTRSLPKD